MEKERPEPQKSEPKEKPKGPTWQDRAECDFSDDVVQEPYRYRDWADI